VAFLAALFMSRLLLLDGYNVLRKIRRFADLSLEDGRTALIRLVQESRPQGSARNGVTIVFDGREDVVSLDSPADVRVIFSKGESADDVIKRLVQESRSPRDIVLVTEDRDLGYFCRSLGAEIWNIARFTAQARKSGEKLRSGVVRRPRKSGEPAENKVIGKVFEDKVNREFSKIWLKE
jgi:predicted RNA-binding protein with PIN domain